MIRLQFEFDASIKEIEDLQVGMVVPGIVTNITKFGAFVDIGVHNDGLVHEYYFDSNGILKNNGWFTDGSGVWCYAFSSGELATGDCKRSD